MELFYFFPFLFLLLFKSSRFLFLLLSLEILLIECCLVLFVSLGEASFFYLIFGSVLCSATGAVLFIMFVRNFGFDLWSY